MEQKKQGDSFPAALKRNSFNLISWGVTALIVAALAGFAFWWTQNGPAAAARPAATDAPAAAQPSLAAPAAAPATAAPAIGRQLELKTDLAAQTNTAITQYSVVFGDSLYGIAKQFNIKPETILYSNVKALQGNIENLKPGMSLTIPPVDGILYTWKQGDSFQSVASQFKVKPDDILSWPGNDLDLTNPSVQAGTVIMIPGGQGQPIDWSQFIPTFTRSSTGTATSELGQAACNSGPVGLPTVWPTTLAQHILSGNDYTAIHQGIDILAPEGTPVLAAGPGVVVFAGWNDTGYGNVIEIDHGNGYSTVYAHLETGSFKVGVCSAVYGGQQIANADSTGNSTGSHLHFEVRLGGVTKDPWDYVH